MTRFRDTWTHVDQGFSSTRSWSNQVKTSFTHLMMALIFTLSCITNGTVWLWVSGLPHSVSDIRKVGILFGTGTCSIKFMSQTCMWSHQTSLPKATDRYLYQIAFATPFCELLCNSYCKGIHSQEQWFGGVQCRGHLRVVGWQWYNNQNGTLPKLAWRMVRGWNARPWTGLGHPVPSSFNKGCVYSPSNR